MQKQDIIKMLNWDVTSEEVKDYLTVDFVHEIKYEYPVSEMGGGGCLDYKRTSPVHN